MSTFDPQNPTPGVYEDLNFDLYKQIQAVNKSSLDHIEEYCPAMCKHRMNNPEPETEALRVGHAFHTLTLEGQGVFDEQYVVATQCVGTLAKGGRCRNAGKTEVNGLFYCGMHAPAGEGSGKCVITEEQDAVVRAMRNGIYRVEECRVFIGSPGKNELTLVWIDEETGLFCKARVDMWRPSWEAIGDLKTTTHAGPLEHQFSRSIKDFGYHRQSAFYLDGAAALGLPAKYFAIFPVEKEAPNTAGAYMMGPESVDLGRSQIRRNLNVYAACKASGEWPGYANGLPTINVPSYEIRKEMKFAGAA